MRAILEARSLTAVGESCVPARLGLNDIAYLSDAGKAGNHRATKKPFQVGWLAEEAAGSLDEETSEKNGPTDRQRAVYNFQFGQHCAATTAFWWIVCCAAA